jgi:PIN domain nuclease of toxin-antitoxin system
MMKYIIDTHALIWFLEGNNKLGENAKKILGDPHSQLILPSIVLAEAIWIVEKGKTSIKSVMDVLR